jgi:hypothetical protein
MKQSSTPITVCSLIAIVLATCGPSLRSAPAADHVKSDARAMSVVVSDEFIADNARSIIERTASLPDTRRFDFLAGWVLPSETHATIRMNGAFTRTTREPNAEHALRLACPAIELIEVASRIKRLQQLTERVTQLPVSTNEEQRRARAAMLFLIHVATGDAGAAKETAQELTTLVQDSTDFDHRRQWPQTVAAWVALRDPQAWPLVADMLTDMRIRQHLEREVTEPTAWSEQLASMHGSLQHLTGGGRLEDFTQPPRLKNWTSASVVTARTSAAGFPSNHWDWKGKQLQCLSSSNQSLLFYRIPLRGDFEVSCELDFDSIGELQLMYAGEHLIPQQDYQACLVGNVREEHLEPLDPLMTPPLTSTWCRILVRDNVCTTWFNGRLVRRRQLVEDHDPWLAIRTTSARRHATIHSLRIDGTPIVPNEVNLCSDKALNGWWSYFDEEIGVGLDWQHIEDDAGRGLFAKRQDSYRGTHLESLLCYYRPLTEGNSLEYDFFYEPDRTHVHPALDGLAFLLQPRGVSLHPISDGKYEQGDADPAVTVVESDYRRGPMELPLKAAAWNRCRLTVRANAVDVSLNDQLIYSRPLQAANQRVFGFFRYAGESEVRLRNVMWREHSTGDFDAVDFETVEQQLVNTAPNPLDDKIDTFESFEHDFAASGLSSDRFEIPSRGDLRVSVARDGVTHFQRSGGKWADSNIIPMLRMQGDFDLTVSFDELQVAEPYHGGCGVALRGQDGRVMLLSRRMRTGKLHRVYLTWRDPVGDGEFRMIKEILISEARAGRFRVARRGDTYHFLFAEYDSPVYRLVGEQTIEGASQQASQVELRTIASLGASASVRWKNVRIAAEGLKRARIKVAGPDITAEQWATIAAADGLEELILESTRVSDADLARLTDCPDLRILDLKNTRITSRGVRHLANLKQLERLYLTRSPVDDTAAATLSQLSELRTLGLSYTQVGDDLVTVLSRLPKLEILGLRNAAVTDASIGSFSKMTSLRSLYITGTDVSDAGVERIQKALPNCTIRR